MAWIPTVLGSESRNASEVSAAGFHVPGTATPLVPLSVTPNGPPLVAAFHPMVSSAPEDAIRHFRVADGTPEDPFGGPVAAILMPPVVVTRGETVGALIEADPYPNP